MKIKIILAVTFAGSLSQAVYVRGYWTHSGTYVSPHFRSSPDSNVYNNYSTYGNYNPYTNEEGTKHYNSNNIYLTPSINDNPLLKRLYSE